VWNDNEFPVQFARRIAWDEQNQVVKHNFLWYSFFGYKPGNDELESTAGGHSLPYTGIQKH
jgi:hypothetical protein